MHQLTEELYSTNYRYEIACFLAWPNKKICPKCILLGTSGVIWGDLGAQSQVHESKATSEEKQADLTPERCQITMPGSTLHFSV